MEPPDDEDQALIDALVRNHSGRSPELAFIPTLHQIYTFAVATGLGGAVGLYLVTRSIWAALAVGFAGGAGGGAGFGRWKVTLSADGIEQTLGLGQTRTTLWSEVDSIEIRRRLGRKWLFVKGKRGFGLALPVSGWGPLWNGSFENDAIAVQQFAAHHVEGGCE